MDSDGLRALEIYLITIQWAQQSIKNILEDVTNYQLAYTTHNDICSVFPGETLLAIQVRSGGCDVKTKK